MMPSRFVVGGALLVTTLLCATGRAAEHVPVQTLHKFDSYATGVTPTAPLVQGTDGNFYGTTRYGGRFGDGTIFRMTPSGSVQVLHEFQEGAAGGVYPSGPLVQASDGNFYGTTLYGGSTESDGTLFRMTPTGTVKVLRAFTGSDGAYPQGLIRAADGHLYGITAYGGTSGRGTVFRTTLDGTLTTLHSFDGGASDGAYPEAIVATSDGSIVGVTSGGGAVPCGYPTPSLCERGTVFRITPDGAFTVVHSFPGGLGGTYPGSLIQASDRRFYGTTQYGGANDGGTIFRITSEGAVTLLHSFSSGTEGYSPVGLVEGSDGNLYGTNRYGGRGAGTLFRLARNGAFAVLHTFTGGADGSEPAAVPIQGRDGAFYGTASGGGYPGFGTVFKMDSTGVLTVLHMFHGSVEGHSPSAPLIEASDGHLYGTTQFGGAFNHGTIFRVTRAGTSSVLHTFSGAFDGGYPSGALVQARDGNLYGTTSRNGAYDQGIIFRVGLDGQFTVLHAFNAVLGGSEPAGGLIESDGYLYGTTEKGGTFNRGTVFRTTLGGEVTVLHSFAGGSADGAFPEASLVKGTGGNFYGTTTVGGSADSGTVFRITPAGAVTILHQFNGTGGIYPRSSLVQGIDGNFYGTTLYGASIFRLTSSGVFTVLFSIGSCYDCDPTVSLTRGADGILYAIRAAGGLFVVDLSGAVTVVQSSVSSRSALLQASDGYLYGASATTVFRLTPVFRPATVVVSSPAGPTVRVAWTAALGATSYTVRRRLLGGGELVVASGLQTTSFIDASVQKGQRYSYIVTAVNRLGESVRSYEVSVTPGRAVAGDFDGDGRADPALFRPSNGTWYWIASRTGTATGSQWGSAVDVPVPGDYDGDGLTDTAVFRPMNGTWYVRSVASGIAAGVQWGNGLDVAVPGDYDGDNKADVAVFRPVEGIWYVGYSGTATAAGFQWGNAFDLPAAADYDGDGKTDIAVFRPSEGAWYLQYSSTGTSARIYLGGALEVPVPADYDGDGKSDIAVYRPSDGTWRVLFSSDGTAKLVQWGARGDIPVPADFDGDGRADIAVFRPSDGSWYFRYSGTETTGGVQWGSNADIPLVSGR